jgi:RNA polymerase sigma-70 factor (ECF subfamily)
MEPVGRSPPCSDATGAAFEPARRRGVSERELVRRCLARDKQAWRLLYDRYFARVAELVQRHAEAGAESDDLCQEIFLIVFRRLQSFRGEGRLRAWIQRVAAREAIRSAKRVRSSRAQGAASSHALAAGRAPARLAGGDEAAHRQYLGQLLRQLPSDRRRALMLFEIEGRPVEEIAELCGCAVNTVWTRIHRARAQLKQIAGNA